MKKKKKRKMEDLALIMIYSVVKSLYAAMLYFAIFMEPDYAFLDARDCKVQTVPLSFLTRDRGLDWLHQ
jgi:hypothetical protein